MSVPISEFMLSRSESTEVEAHGVGKRSVV
jgi:hypothetical protein